jgi:sugar (pentulose or hexulose) kinase
MRYLGVDIGSSFIKGAVLDLDEWSLRHIERLPFPEPVRGLDPKFREFDPDEVVAATRALLERLLRHAPDATGVLMCSQLHGLVLTNDDGSAASNFINWQDQRALMPWPDGGGTYFDEINRLITRDERRQLGNEPLPGVPLSFLFWLARNRALPCPPVFVAALPYFIIANLCGETPKSDVTHAYGHGALNIESLDWHVAVIEKLGLGGVRWPKIVPQGALVGEWRVGPRALAFFAPVGDYHCSQVGAFLDEGELSVNVSTGSAVIRLADGCESGDFQTRPWFDGRYLKTITHIPGGRALNALVRLLSELAESQGVKLRDPWDHIFREAERVQATDLEVNPAFYFGSMGDRGSIRHLREENMTLGHLFRAAFTGMADNYAHCAARISPGRDWRRVVFSGGVALKTALLRDLIRERLGREHRLAPSDEDTLFGLLVLSLAFSKRLDSVKNAMAFARQRDVQLL